METKHTKGKWRYNVSKRNDIQVILPNNKIIELGHIYPDDCGLPTCCKVEEHANAKLIAAAPELLEALIHLTANAGLIREVVKNEGSLLYENYNNAIKAIKKATE